MERPTILVEPGRLPYLADAAEQVLLKDYRRWSLFQRAGMIVRVVSQTQEDQDRHVHRPHGALILRTATIPMLADVLNQAIRWRAGTPLKDRDIDCPAKIPSTILSRSGLWHLHELVGIVATPVMRPDGTVITASGYDESTGLLLESPIAWPALPAPSRAAAEGAVKCLTEPFLEFPFGTPAGWSVLLSAILTGVQRRLLPTAPAHAFDAPSQGSGKTLAADCVSLIVTGHCVASISANQDRDGEEFRKKLTAIGIAGDQIVNIDNVTKPFHCDALATFLTQSEYRDRVLGVSQMIAVPTNVLFIFTGNNLTFSGDMPSRVISARLEPNVERPEERTFRIPNLRAHVLDRRSQLASAALTILQSYFFAGRPSQNLKPFGRFEKWSEEVRSAIVWAGLPDPCITREEIIASDPERDATLAAIEAWFHEVGDGKVTLQSVIQRASENADLKAALLEIAADIDHSHEISSRRLGAWCRARAGRVVGDFKLSRAGAAHAGFAAWQVVRVAETNSQVSKLEEITREI